MKTAISIPDRVFAAAERAAKRLGLSRSQFYTLAARRMLRRIEARRLTAKVDEALRAANGAEQGLEAGLARLQSAALADERW